MVTRSARIRNRHEGEQFAKNLSAAVSHLDATTQFDPRRH
jgi:hypothetical protein